MPQYKCPRCAILIDAASPQGLTCPACGYPGADRRGIANPIAAGFAPAARQVNWLALLLVSIFVGSLGVDRFMMGHVGLGILKLLTLGGCGIWWLIDLILIATKHQFEGIIYVET